MSIGWEDTGVKAAGYERMIYVGAHNPYASWLKVATEKDMYEQRLPAYLSNMAIGKKRDHASILDLGCGFGSTAGRLLRALRKLGIEFDYTGVDPYAEQLRAFLRPGPEEDWPMPRLVVGDIEAYAPERVYTLVHASHALYYTKDMRVALERIASLGREAIIVHHGARGIHEFHRRFRSEVGPGPHIISTDDEVAWHLAQIDLSGRRVRRLGFTSTVDISACLDPGSRDGQNLLSFFFERGYESLDAAVLREARAWLHETCPRGLMTHDVGVFLITS